MNDRNHRGVLDELAALPTMAHPTRSPAGDQIALYYDITGRNEVHVLDPGSGALEQWSTGDVPRSATWPIQWSGDGDRVLFHQDDAGNEQHDIHAIGADGTTDSLVELDGQSLVYDARGSIVLFGSNRDGQLNLYRYDETTEEVDKLTEYERAVWDAHLAPSGETIAYATNESDDFDNRDVYVADIDGADSQNLAIGETGAEASPKDWHPDGDRLLVADNTTDLWRVGVYDLEQETIEWYGDDAVEEQAIAFVDDGTKIVAVAQRAAATIPVLYEVDSGQRRELGIPEGVASFGPSPHGVTLEDGRLVFLHTTPTRRPELWAYDMETDEHEVILEAEYGPFDSDDFVDAEYLTVNSDGIPATPARAVDHDPYATLDIEALLFDPGDRPGALVVNPHGGPRARNTKSFNVRTQALALSGYAVLQVNYRESTGRGRRFVETLIDDWGGGEQGDIAVVTEHVLETHDWIDEERVAVFGGSYGGYSVYWQLVQYPDLYAAGVAWIGLTDLERMYEETLPHFRTELMEKYLGTPEENPELYAERSPIEYVANVAGPLLLVHGVNDSRVPVSQARRFKAALVDAGYEEGTDFEYEELGEEGHGSTDQRQQQRMFELLIDFLDQQLK